MRHQPSSASACVRWPALWTWKPLMKDNWKMLVQYIVPGWRPNNGGGEQDNKRNECTDQSNHYPHNHTEHGNIGHYIYRGRAHDPHTQQLLLSGENPTLTI